MPKILWKSLHLCFPSNLTKCYSTPCLPPSSVDPDASDNPNRPSIVLINNFDLLYHHSVVDLPSSSTTTTPVDTTTTSSSSTSSFESDISPDLSAAFASRRFFFSSPGQSNSITDSPETRSRELSDSNDSIITTKNKKKTHDTTVKNTTRLLIRGTAVKQHVYSPDPISDFRRSMQEMIDAAIDDGELIGSDDGYNFLNELLLSYLSLNPIDTHKFVIRAFSDILVSLLSKERELC